MSSDRTPTRRETIKYGGTLAVAGMLAGCSAETAEQEGEPQTNDDGSSAGGNQSDADPKSDTDEPSQSDSYTVPMAPMGDVEFDSVPESAFTVFPWYADMAFALGHGDSINSLWWADEFDRIMQYFTDDLDGVSTSWNGLSGTYGATKERLYQLDSDVHLVDPAWVSSLDNWDQDDVDTLATDVAPWFGNQYSNLHFSPPEAWTDRYEYYTLWELFEKVAAIYQEQARYQKLAKIHTDLVGSIQSALPPEEDRPTVGYVQMATDLSSIYLLRLNAPGYYNSHTRPLGAVDSFSDVNYDGGEFAAVDFEALLDADPDVLLTLWGMTSNVDFQQLRSNLEDHPTGGELSAVQNDRVYTQGTRYQGPILNLYQLEMTAKQLYPDEFGEWPGYADGDSYPEFADDEQLFDRQRVANIINGNYE